MSGDHLGNRMKSYEQVWGQQLPTRLPLIIRLDGKAFHTWTRGLDRPFDERLSHCMRAASMALADQVQGCALVYSQSDEISLLLTDWSSYSTQPWLGGKLQKMISVSASITTAAFNDAARGLLDGRGLALFDSRAFVLPPHEVVNYFIWRQMDAERNSKSMLAQSVFSHKELHKKSTKDMLLMLEDKGVIWGDLPEVQKRGFCVTRKYAPNIPQTKGPVDLRIPRFTQDREYITSKMPELFEAEA